MNKLQKLTLVMIFDQKKILLGMKKRGFGVGKWNGFGGKVKSGENIINGAIRELQEESGLAIKNRSTIKKAGKIEFCFEHNINNILEVNIFSVSSHDVAGEIIETEEMLPKWFKIDEIPFEKMWISDREWFPMLLKRQKFMGKILFSKDGNKILKKELIVK
jgi:ADP-ribose pyrophosphatase YjhB (NUDIX family)